MAATIASTGARAAISVSVSLAITVIFPSGSDAEQPQRDGDGKHHADDVFRNARRLRVPQHRDANRFNVTCPAADPVEGIGLSSAPAGEKKATSNGLVVAVKMPQQRDQFIPLDEKPSARAIFSVTEGRPAVVRTAGPLVYRKLIAAKTFEPHWFQIA